MKLKDRVFVDKSFIHGKGTFAKVGIAEGTHIGNYKGPTAKRDGRYVLWVDEGNGDWVGVSGKNRLRYLNHSSSPNAEFDGVELYALRDIEAGEEITFDYGEEWEGVE